MRNRAFLSTATARWLSTMYVTAFAFFSSSNECMCVRVRVRMCACMCVWLSLSVSSGVSFHRYGSLVKHGVAAFASNVLVRVCACVCERAVVYCGLRPPMCTYMRVFACAFHSYGSLAKHGVCFFHRRWPLMHVWNQFVLCKCYVSVYVKCNVYEGGHKQLVFVFFFSDLLLVRLACRWFRCLPRRTAR